MEPGRGINFAPTRHIFHKDTPRMSRPSSSRGVGPIQLKEVAPSRENSTPRNMFNASVQRNAEANAANVRKANTPIPEPIWHIPGLDDAPRNNIMPKMDRTIGPEPAPTVEANVNAWKAERATTDARHTRERNEAAAGRNAESQQRDFVDMRKYMRQGGGQGTHRACLQPGMEEHGCRAWPCKGHRGA